MEGSLREIVEKKPFPLYEINPSINQKKRTNKLKSVVP
jgi:hypothetical protein